MVEAENIVNNTYNKRQDVMAEKVIRGNILSADGNIIATTITDSEGNEKRYYPYNNLFAHVAGYLNNGGYGIESNNWYYMLGSHQNIWVQLINDLQGKKKQGDNIITTLDSGLSQAAYDALGDNDGSVVILEPSTGAILTMISKPDFNPNTLEEEWNSIVSDENSSVLLNRATQGMYPPGSTFKIVTLLEYIRENPDTFGNYAYECNGSYEISDTTSISCSHQTAHGMQDTVMSFANSCNASFINMGLSLDLKKYSETAEQLLFNKELPIPMEYNKSRFDLEEDAGKWDIAQTAFGQGRTLISPMHLAMIGSAIANDGVLMNPYIITSVESCENEVVKSFATSEYGALMTQDEAAILKSDMEAVTNVSFGWLYGESSYKVAGKSGTAQFGTKGYEHSLYISYSPVENPEIVVAVVVEGDEDRSISGAEVAKKIYDYYYSR